jgi:hypothetical protein
MTVSALGATLGATSYGIALAMMIRPASLPLVL